MHEDGYFQEELADEQSHRSEEAKDSDEFLDRIQEYQPYDPAVIEELMAEGFTELEAIAIAATTMDGAGEQAGGVISSRQTACAYLRYAESTNESVGQIEGRREIHKHLRLIFNLPPDYELTDEETDLLVDAALAADMRAAAEKSEPLQAEVAAKIKDLQRELSFVENALGDLNQDTLDFEVIFELLELHKSINPSGHEEFLLKMRVEESRMNVYRDLAKAVRAHFLKDLSNLGVEKEK